MALTLHGTVSDNTVALDRKTATPLIINGDMQIAQRGTSFSPSSSVDFYSIDRFAYFATSGATGDATITQATDAPSNTGLVKSLKITPDATETPTGTHNMCFAYSLEGQDVQVLQHGSTSPESVTLAFWVKSNKTGTYCVQIKEENITDESYVLFEYTINSSNTWEKKVISWTGNSAHTINNDNAQGYRILRHLATGSDDHASATTSWTVSSSFKATSNQVNFFDSTSNELYITGVQLEVGTFDANSIADFQHEDVGTSLNRCRRYCFVSGYSGDGGAKCVADYGIAIGATVVNTYMDLKPEMRTAPSMTNSGALNISNGSSAVAATAIAISSAINSRQFAGIQTTCSSGLTGGALYRIEEQGSSGAKIILDAEL